MKVKTKELLDKLNLIKPALYTKGILEQADHFLFTGNEIVTYNDRFSIRVPFKTEEKFSVPGQEFLKVISGLNEEEFDLSFEDNQVMIQAGNTKSGISTFQGSLFELIEPMISEKDKWKSLPDDFNNAAFLSMFSVSKDVSRGVMAHLSVNNDEVASSDDLRISMYKLKSSLKSSFLLPLTSVIELVKISMTEFLLKDTWVHFRNKDRTVFSSRVLLDTFLNYQEFFDVQGDSVQLPDKLKAVVDGVTIFAEGDFDLDKKITVTIDKNKIICKGEKEKGWIEKSMEFKYKGKKLSFLVNPIFFSQVLDKSTEVIIGENTALFKSGDFSHVMVLPV